MPNTHTLTQVLFSSAITHLQTHKRLSVATPNWPLFSWQGTADQGWVSRDPTPPQSPSLSIWQGYMTTHPGPSMAIWSLECTRDLSDQFGHPELSHPCQGSCGLWPTCCPSSSLQSLTDLFLVDPRTSWRPKQIISVPTNSCHLSHLAQRISQPSWTLSLPYPSADLESEGIVFPLPCAQQTLPSMAHSRG